MNGIMEILTRMSKSKIPQEDEYLNEADGLIYCRSCNTPRQTRILLKGSDEPFCPPVMCRCQKEKRDREASARAEARHTDLIRKLRSEGLSDRALCDFTFENDSGASPQIEKARRYVGHFEQMEELGEGLLLWGDVGSGKTFMAGCIANALIDQEIPVLMTNFSRILLHLTSNIQEDKNSFLDSLNRYRLLILYDLGIERSSEFALEQIYNVIDRRCQSRRPMIITTNLTLDTLKHPPDIMHSRIYDRIMERCLPVLVSGKQLRQQHASDNFSRLKSIFGD